MTLGVVPDDEVEDGGPRGGARHEGDVSQQFICDQQRVVRADHRATRAGHEPCAAARDAERDRHAGQCHDHSCGGQGERLLLDLGLVPGYACEGDGLGARRTGSRCLPELADRHRAVARCGGTDHEDALASRPAWKAPTGGHLRRQSSYRAWGPA